MIYTINAIDRDGLRINIFTLKFDVFRDGIDIVDACKAAAREFTATSDGFCAYMHNCENFNWGDFVDVPNTICEKYGFRKINAEFTDTDVDYNEQLIDEPAFVVSDIKWDIGGEHSKAVARLPKECCIAFSDLLTDEESLEQVNPEELKDRIADYLLEGYGFCILGYVIH